MPGAASIQQRLLDTTTIQATDQPELFLTCKPLTMLLRPAKAAVGFTGHPGPILCSQVTVILVTSAERHAPRVAGPT